MYIITKHIYIYTVYTTYIIILTSYFFLLNFVEYIFMKRQVQGQHDIIIYIVSWILSQIFSYSFFIFISAVKRLITNNNTNLFT